MYCKIRGNSGEESTRKWKLRGLRRKNENTGDNVDRMDRGNDRTSFSCN